MLEIEADADLLPFLESAESGRGNDEVPLFGGEGGIKQGLLAELLEEIDLRFESLLLVGKVAQDRDGSRTDAGDEALIEPIFVEALHPGGGDGQSEVASFETEEVFAAFLGDASGEKVHLGRADESGHELVDGVQEDLLRGPDMLDDAVFQDDDLGAHGHGFHLIVGDVDEDGLELIVEAGDL